MNVLKIRIVDWWERDTKKNFYNNWLIKLLSAHFKIEYSNKPDFIFYSSFGKKHLDYDCVRIFYTGENIRGDFDVADYVISPDLIVFNDRHFSFPHCFYDEFLNEVFLALKKPKINVVRNRFCAFMTSAPCEKYSPREEVFKTLCEYKKVDSGGRYLNNLGKNGGGGGQPIGDRFRNFGESKIKWLKNYKFNLCFENSASYGYLTEKLFQSYAAGCIPIYWGDCSILTRDCIETLQNLHYPNIFSQMKPQFVELPFKINSKSYINAARFENIGDLIDEIKRVDCDEKLYLQMANEPIFTDDFNPDFYKQNLIKYLIYIFSQPPNLAFRRAKGHLIDYKLQEQKSYALFLRQHKKRDFFKIFRKLNNSIKKRALKLRYFLSNDKSP